MPYIKQEYRNKLDTQIKALGDAIIGHVPSKDLEGKINYAITKLLKELYPTPNYDQYNRIIGVLECCKLEVYRKQTAPYEDQKEYENGSV